MTLYMNGKPIGECVDISESYGTEPISDEERVKYRIQDTEITGEITLTPESNKRLQKLIEELTIPECVVTDTHAEALKMFDAMYRKRRKYIKSARRYPYPTIEFINGWSCVFVSERAYRIWNKGRIYTVHGVKMKGGFPVKEDDEK